MKKVKIFICGLLVVLTFCSFAVPSEAASSTTVDLGGGYKLRIDKPHENKTGKYHGHVYKKGKEIGSENVDGTKHDGKDFSKVPKKTKEKIKSNKKWKDAKEKNSKFVKARNAKKWKDFLTWIVQNSVILNL